MESKILSPNNHSFKALVVICLLLLSTFVAGIAWMIRIGDNIKHFIGHYFLWDFSIFFSLIAFVLIKSKQKAALILSVIATLFSLASIILDAWGFISITAIFSTFYPVVLCVLLTIYCASPSSTICYLFGGITGFLLIIINVLSAFTGDVFGNSTLATVYVLGFLSNSDVLSHLNTQKKKKANIVSVVNQLEKFAQLKEDGILTTEEFEAKKQELMNQM